MYWLQLVVIVALLAAVGWLAIGGGGHMSEPTPDRPDLALPGDGLLAREDVDRVRFSVGARGYRMDEVDDVLDRLAQEIEVRERRIAELEGRAPEQGESPDGQTEAEPESDVEAAAGQGELNGAAEHPAEPGETAEGTEGAEGGVSAEHAE